MASDDSEVLSARVPPHPRRLCASPARPGHGVEPGSPIGLRRAAKPVLNVTTVWWPDGRTGQAAWSYVACLGVPIAAERWSPDQLLAWVGTAALSGTRVQTCLPLPKML